MNKYLISPIADDSFLPSVGGLVIGKTSPSRMVWDAGSRLNHIQVSRDKFFRHEGNIVDLHQKPVALYGNLIRAFSSKGDWVLDACCGTGKWNIILYTILKMDRSYTLSFSINMLLIRPNTTF